MIKRMGCVVLSLLLSGVASAAPAPISGSFYTENDRAVVHIAPCGAAVCATIVARGPGTPKDAPPVLDSHNQNASLRNRPLIGLTILNDGRATGDHWSGNIYSPDDGRSFLTTLVAVADGIKVRGCWGIICRTQVWKPAH